MKKTHIVIIGQWTAPLQTPRAHRTWQLAQELARQGNRVVLYALTGPTFDYAPVQHDTGLIVKNLGISKHGCTDSEGGTHESFFAKYLRKALHEPDLFPGRDLYPMVRKALQQEGDIDLLITVATPHVIHWATAAAIDRSRIGTWIADCGDPYMGNPFFKHPFFMEKRERKWSGMCDFITVPIESAKSAYYPEYQDKIRVIPQGFRLDGIPLPPYTGNPVPSFAYAGVTYKGLRDPRRFLDFLSGLEGDFHFSVFSRNDKDFRPYLDRFGGRMELCGSLPREALLPRLAGMDFLINLRNGTGVQQPSKLIDYSLTGRPILEISSEFPQEEQDTLAEFLKGNYEKALPPLDLEPFCIENVARQFLDLAGLAT